MQGNHESRRVHVNLEAEIDELHTYTNPITSSPTHAKSSLLSLNPHSEPDLEALNMNPGLLEQR